MPDFDSSLNDEVDSDSEYSYSYYTYEYYYEAQYEYSYYSNEEDACEYSTFDYDTLTYTTYEWRKKKSCYYINVCIVFYIFIFLEIFISECLSNGCCHYKINQIRWLICTN